MQNKYVGDIGDFGRYGLLREIFGRPEELGSGCGLRLAVAWYFNKDERGAGGDMKDYPKLRNCDHHLYDLLQRMVKSGKPKISDIERSDILPTKVYHSIPFPSTTRTKWFKGVLEATKDAAVVFVDPDNGIASENTPVGSPKHVLPHELERFYERGQSLVVYHHLARTTAKDTIKSRANKLKEFLGLQCMPWAFWYRRGPGRVYFIVPHDSHREKLDKCIEEFKSRECWFKKQPDFPHPHFKLVTSPSA